MHAMTALPLDELSERQRQCLRLYYQNYEAKEIASQLGLSPHTVHEHLRKARETLRVGRSMEAARLLVAHEGNNRFVSDAIGIEPDGPHDDSSEAISPANGALIARNRYELGLLARLGLILAVAFIAVALAGALIVGAEAITELFWEYQIDISDPPY